MGILDRIKKRQLDGFKEFVQNMEITGVQARIPIFTSAILEDPIFISWVMKNIKTFDDFLSLPSDEIDAVLTGKDQILNIFAKCMFGQDEQMVMNLENLIPRHMAKFKDELSYMKDITSQQIESARFYMVKEVRKLQAEDKIRGFSWNLPPMEVFYPKVYQDGPNKIIFENGVVAAEGEHLKGKRVGLWKHFYDSGKILGEGNYLDGLKSGPWVFYYASGVLRAEGRYKLDQKHGFWKEWDRAGSESEVEYQEGVKRP